MAETDVPDELRKTLDRLGRKALATVIRYASARLGAMGGAEGGAKRWTGTTAAERSEAARRAVQARWAKVKLRRRRSKGRKAKD